MKHKMQRQKGATRTQGFRLTESDEQALEYLSTVLEVGRADVVRLLIRRAAKEVLREASDAT